MKKQKYSIYSPREQIWVAITIATLVIMWFIALS